MDRWEKIVAQAIKVAEKLKIDVPEDLKRTEGDVWRRRQLQEQAILDVLTEAEKRIGLETKPLTEPKKPEKQVPATPPENKAK